MYFIINLQHRRIQFPHKWRLYLVQVYFVTKTAVPPAGSFSVVLHELGLVLNCLIFAIDLIFARLLDMFAKRPLVVRGDEEYLDQKSLHRRWLVVPIDLFLQC